MSTMIPVIWIVELDLLDKRVNGNETTVAPSLESNSGVSGLIAFLKCLKITIIHTCTLYKHVIIIIT